MTDATSLDLKKLCICGCELGEHHLVWWAGGAISADECERYGWNETGGLKQNALGQWEEHCMSFRYADPTDVDP